MEYILSPKSELLLYLTKQGLLIANKSFNFFQDYNLLNETLHQINDQDYNIFKFIYHFRNNIHALLYECDQTIKIDEFKLKFDFEELFYLDLLINENEEIINYSYDFDLLINFYNFIILKNEASNYFIYKIVIMRAFLTLIKNFCDSDNYNEDINEEKIDKIKNEVETEFNKYIDKFKEVFNINEDIREMKLDNLYSKILISLIKSNKFDDYNYLYNILNEMELEKIDIGNAILIPFQETLKENNDYMKKFIIKTEEDLYKENAINFYYILLNFILKGEFFIYQISFLLETKNRIIKLIKSKKFKNNLNNKLSKETIERFKYVLEMFAGSKYYFEQNKEEINKLETVLKYYKLFYFETKVKDIEKIEQDIKNQNEDSEYLKYFEEAVNKMNIYPIIKFIYFTFHDKEVQSEKSLNDSVGKFNTVFQLIKDRKFGKMRNKEAYSQFFKDKTNHELLLKVFNQEDIDSFFNSFKNDNKNKKEEEKKNFEENIPAPSPIYAQTPKEEKKEESKNKIYMCNGNDIKCIKNNNDNNKNMNIITSPKTNPNFFSNTNNREDINIDNYPEVVKNILKKSLIKLKTNPKNKSIEYEDNLYYGDTNIIMLKDTFINLINGLPRENALKIFFNEVEYKLKTEFNHDFTLKLDIELKNIDKYNIEAIYTMYDPKNENVKLSSYKDENILIRGTESNLQGFNFMISDINLDKYKGLDYLVNKPINDEVKKENSKNTKIIPGISNIASEEKILQIIKIIENKNSDNGFIKEINNDFFIYVRSDNIVVLLDKHFNPIMEINDYYNSKIVNACDLLPEKENIQIVNENENINENVYEKPVEFFKKSYLKDDSKSISNKSTRDKSISQRNEIPDNKETPKGNGNEKPIQYKMPDNLKIVLCSNKYFFLTNINLKEKKTETKKLDISRIFGFSSIEIKNNNYLITGKNCTSYIIDLFTNASPQENVYIDGESYFNSIRINERSIALVSNSVYPGAQDVLKFFNLKKKKYYQRIIGGYSFILSPNGLELMPKLNKDNKFRILLCACKKYKKEQKNGILLVNAQMDETMDIEHPFYDTDNFEVYCFCPILSDGEEQKEKNSGNKKLIDTNYFLVGGFDTELREGKILLYKINYGERAYNTTIEFKQEIIFKDRDDIDAFNGPINCLRQSKKTGNIAASCFDGNIYLLTPPNINYYIEEDNNIAITG